MAPEFSGLWRSDTWSVPGSGSRFYWSLPSLLVAMDKGQRVALPAASLGEWHAAGGGTDWSNAVRAAIATHFTPDADRTTGTPPWPKAVYQGLGALPSYQTEDVLYRTVANAKRLKLEQWTWDAGTYLWCKPASVCNGSAVVEGDCCDGQNDWEPHQGDYMPRNSRFPERGFMALQHAIGDAVGSTAGHTSMGVWITPQASYLSRTYNAHPELYASRAVQFHPHGGQSDFVWLSARTPHAGPQYVR